MTSSLLYSIRMRSSAESRHVSGAERLVHREFVEDIVQTMVSRALSRGVDPDQVVITVESLKDAPVQELRSLDLTATAESGVADCRQSAREMLLTAGVSHSAIETAFRHLDCGASSSSKNMRGAMIMDAVTGERLEPDHERGVRVSRFDWNDEASERIDRELAGIGLTHFRTKEALALATKVAHAPGMIAELCWSDETDYTAGYISSPVTGYVRFPNMKQEGNGLGGRVFFVRRGGFGRDALLTYLQRQPVIITSIGTCCKAD
jgi:6-carboxyhexanoate--CoA ligase